MIQKNKFTKIFIFIFIFLALFFSAVFYFYRLTTLTDFGDSSTRHQAYLLDDKNNSYQCPDCNVLMISLGNVGAEHMGLYGYHRNTTPFLNKWAKDAVVFENTFSQSSWTLPVAVSVFTSLYPYTHNIMSRNISAKLDANTIILPELLENNGYSTAAFTGGLDYSPIFSFMNGFKEAPKNPPFTNFDVTFSQASTWLKQNINKKFFLMVHGYDAHCPFVPPNEIKGTFSNVLDKSKNLDEKLCLRGYEDPGSGDYEAYYYKTGNTNKVILTSGDIKYLSDLYDEEVLSVDKQLSEFLGNIPKKILNKTIFIIFADHGEMFAKHGRFGRAGTIRGTLYDDVLKVPLIIKVPGGKPKRIDDITQLIDIMPTIIDILKIKTYSDDFQGKSLLPQMNGFHTSDENKFSFAGTEFGIGAYKKSKFYFPKKTFNESIRSRKWKLIHEITLDSKNKVTKETFELYNLIKDPDELNNVKLNNEEVFKSLKERLIRWSEKTKRLSSRKEADIKYSDELIETAKNYGYW